MGTRIGPEHLRDFERRRSLRFVLPRQEDITLVAEGRVYRGKLEDVSIGGAKLSLDDAVQTGDVLHLQHAVAGTIEAVTEWQQDRLVGVSFALSVPALDLISLCLRQGVPNAA